MCQGLGPKKHDEISEIDRKGAAVAAGDHEEESRQLRGREAEASEGCAIMIIVIIVTIIITIIVMIIMTTLF